MAAPTPSARPTPSGKRLHDGWQTLVAFKARLTLAFWVTQVDPPGLEGDSPKELGTMHNTRWRTMMPRRLITMTPFSITVMWDPVLYSTIVAAVNVVDTITIFFPDLSSVCFYGFLKSFKPDALEEGKLPTAKLEIVPTNTDPSDCSEAAPVYTAGPGTGACA